MLTGQELIAAADLAAETAGRAAEQVNLRMNGGRANQNGQCTPPKRKKRRALSQAVRVCEHQIQTCTQCPDAVCMSHSETAAEGREIPKFQPLSPMHASVTDQDQSGCS